MLSGVIIFPCLVTRKIPNFARAHGGLEWGLSKQGCQSFFTPYPYLIINCLIQLTILSKTFFLSPFINGHKIVSLITIHAGNSFFPYLPLLFCHDLTLIIVTNPTKVKWHTPQM